MPSAVRALVFCLLVFGAAGCGGSNNKGKIEGRWKFVSVGAHPDEPKLRDMDLVFGEEGQVLLIRPGVPNPTVWRYKLLAGDAADFYDLPSDATERGGLFPNARGTVRATIRIEVATGDKYERREMTLTDASGRELKLTRIR